MYLGTVKARQPETVISSYTNIALFKEYLKQACQKRLKDGTIQPPCKMGAQL
ncbi:hypothetical protein GCM10025791_38590 [Halioxenophilus aromaticivorans]|uniref:Transposase n=1 Tax=Halioxenophilus aromaticivorans TaxID=1306992 RepID=A0AAV3U6P5_9ALTE